MCDCLEVEVHLVVVVGGKGRDEVVTTFKCINSRGGGDISEVSAMFVTII